MNTFKEKYGYTHDEILAHYGYKPDVVRTCGVGIWAKEDAFQRLEYLPDFMKYVNAMCTVADGHSEHQNIMAAAYLLGTMLADVQEERRSAEYNGAIMKVDEIIRECGKKGEADE